MRLDIMQDHAGTVIGGITDVRRPCRPRSISPPSTGSSPRQRSSTSDGSAQSSPMIMTLETGIVSESDPSPSVVAQPAAATSTTV